MDISKLLQDKKDEIEKEKALAAKKALEEEQERTIYTITSQTPDFKINELLSQIDFIEDVEEVLKEQLYHFKIKADDKDEEKEKFRLLTKVFRKYTGEINSQHTFKRSTQENVNSPYEPYLHKETHQSDEDYIKDLKNPYFENKRADHELMLNINHDKIIDKYAGFMSEVYDNISKKEAIKFVSHIYHNAKKMHQENPSYGTHKISYLKLFDYESDDFSAKSYEIESSIKEFCKNLEEMQEEYNIRMGKKSIGFLLMNALEAAGLSSLEMESNKKWQATDSDEVADSLQKELHETSKKYDIPYANTLTGQGGLEFFHHFNFAERDYSVEKPIVKEIFNTMSALFVAEYREHIFQYLDNAMDKSSYESLDDFVENFDPERISFEKFQEFSPVNKAVKKPKI